MDIKTQFKRRLYPVALDIEEALSIPPDFCITQAAHESNWGASELARIAENIFGMTAGAEWVNQGKPVFSIKTKEYSKLPPEKIRYWNREGDIKDKKEDGKGGSILMVEVDFRKYGNWNESMMDWANKISTDERYSKAYEMAKLGIPDAFFYELQSAGYATDPLYGVKLFNLFQEVEKIGVS